MRIFTVLVIVFAGMLGNHLVAQPDTIVAFDVQNRTISLIPPVPVDTNIQFDHSSSSVGPLGNQSILSLVPPTTNLFPGSQFSQLARAELFDPVTDFPARTAIRIWYWEDDTLRNDCSGMMVGDQFVLTAAHCVYTPFFGQTWLGDSLLVAPAYDNGQFQPNLPTSKVSHCYIFKKHYDNNGWHDIALLQLQEPIGQTTGHIGMAFTADTSYFSGKVFHKYSYPMQPSFMDTSLHYNGDTLYYNYGVIGSDGGWLTIPSGTALAAQGQSGSSIFYTDNQDYYSFGVLSYASQYRHYQIGRDAYYQLTNVMATQSVGLPENPSQAANLQVFPNPFSSSTTIRFANPRGNRLGFQVLDAQGRMVSRMDGLTGEEITFERGNLAGGLYFFQLLAGERIIGRGKFVVE
ncbi:MAG: trypsin-like serine protease [Bacteroidetes bacterium]|nr:trypsin-like serine protease [Bacteroidota bacterium]